MDWIELTGLRFYGYTGALPEEQVLGQWFEVGLRLGADLSQVGDTDRLEDTIDYRQVIDITQRLVRGHPFATLERLATAIATALLSEVSSSTGQRLQQVQVRLTKLHPPIPDFSGQVTIDITRP